jgi:hypothetical protein
MPAGKVRKLLSLWLAEPSARKALTGLGLIPEQMLATLPQARKPMFARHYGKRTLPAMSSARCQRKSNLPQRRRRRRERKRDPWAGMRQRRRPPFAKSLRAGRMTMLDASPENRGAPPRVAVPRRSGHGMPCPCVSSVRNERPTTADCSSDYSATILRRRLGLLAGARLRPCLLALSCRRLLRL